MSRKWSAIILAAIMFVLLRPVSAMAANNVVTDWTWNPHTYGILHEGYLCATTSWNGKYYSYTNYLPRSITATVDGVAGQTVSVENWTCTDPAGTTAYAHGGVYTFTATLKSPYKLQDGTNTLTLKLYGDGWYQNGSSNSVPTSIGWNADHTVYTVTSQDSYPEYRYGNYSPTYSVYLADGNQAVLNTTDPLMDSYNAQWENEIHELFNITGATATITGRTDTTYVTPGFGVTHAGNTTVYLNNYKVTSRESQFSSNRMNLFAASDDQTVTIVYSGTCQLPNIMSTSTGNKKLIFKPADSNSVLYVERLYRNGNNNFSVEFDGGKVYVESGMSAGSITVKNGCKLHATLDVIANDNGTATFLANTIVIDGSTVTTSAASINNFNYKTVMGSSDYWTMKEGSSITIQNGSHVTVDSSDIPASSTGEYFFTGIGNSETITITDSTVIVKQRDVEYSDRSNYNVGTDASIGNVFKTLTIKNSTVTSDAYYGAAIGMGGSSLMADYESVIVIEDSVINASSGYGAGIGIGYGDTTRASVDITIKGSSVINARSVNGAGIGGGAKSSSGTDPDAVIINPSIPGGWENVDGGSFGTYSLRRSVTPVEDSERVSGLYTTGQTLKVETTASGTPKILAESAVRAIDCESVTTDVTIVQNTTKTAATSVADIKVDETKLGTLREDFKSIAATMPSVSEGVYGLTYSGAPMVNWSDGVAPLYGNAFQVKEKQLNRFWAEPQLELGGTVYIANSSYSTTVLTSSTTGTTLYASIYKLTPTSATKTSPTPDKITYQWYKDGEPLEGQTGSLLSALRTGKPGVYYCVVSGENLYYGSVTSNAVTVYKSTTSIPAAPQLDTKGNDYITVKAPQVQDSADTAVYEYSIDGGVTWQDGLTFTGLEQNTSYSIIRRVKNTDASASTVTPGPASAALVVKTTGDAPDADAILAAIDYEQECFDASKLPAGVVLYKMQSTSTSYKLDAGNPGSLTAYIVDHGKTEKVIYAKYSDGDVWTTVTIPARPEDPTMYPEDILAATTTITIAGTPGVAYNYAKTGETPATGTAVICDTSGKVTFTNLTSDTEYTIHARIPASNVNKNFHSAQTSINGKTLPANALVTTIYIPAGESAAKTYDLSEVLGDKTFSTLPADGAVIATATASEKSVTLTPTANASGMATLNGNLADGSTITIKVIISDEVVGQDQQGTILWMWKQDDEDLSAGAEAYLDSGDVLDIGTSRRLVPVYASGINAGKRVPDSIAGTADVLLPYWDNTAQGDRWLLVYQKSDATVEKIDSLALQAEGISLTQANSGVYGLYTIKSTYTAIPVSVSVSGVYGTPLAPEGSALENGFTPSDNAKWSFMYSTDGGKTYSADVPEKVGTYHVKAVFIDPINQRRGETVAPFSIDKAPLTVTANEHTVVYGDDPANNGVTYSGFVNSETESVLEGSLTYDYSYVKGDDVGEYLITPKGLTAANYTITFVDGTLFVEQATPADITEPSAADPISYGQLLSAAVLSDPDWSWVDAEQVPTVQNTGYAAYVTVDGKNYNYTGVEGYDSTASTVTRTIPVTVTSKSLQAAGIALTLTENTYPYDGADKTPTIMLMDGNTQLVLGADYQVKTGSTTTASTVSTYTITLFGIGNYSDEISETWAITKTEASLTTSPAAVANLIYNGTEQRLVSSGSATGGIVVYALEENGTYTAEIPVGTDAETYTVWYYVQGDENHSDTEKTFAEVTIKQKEVTPSISGTVTKVYDGEVTVPDGLFIILTGVVNADDLNATATFAYDAANVGTTTINATSIALIGDQSSNYVLTTTIASADVGEITPKVITNPTIVLDASSFVYDGTEKKPAVTSVKDGDNLIDVAEYTVSYTNNIEMGTATVTLTDVAGGNYTVSGSTTFQITQSGTEMTATADKTSYTYGETITVTGTVKATGTAPAATLTLRSAPAAQQVALFAADGTQLTDPVNVVNGAYALTYNTTDKGILPAASITLTVKFVGDEDMADATANVNIALTEKQLTATEATATTRAYEPGNTTVTITEVKVSGAVGTDDVKVDATNLTGEITSADAGTYTSVALTDLTLSGNDKAFYTITDATVTTSVEITPKVITNPTIVLDASSFVYDGTEKKPAVTSVKDGDDLIDAAEYTVSYTNNIEMGTATVTLTDVEGGNYTVSGSTTFQITQSGTEMTATADKTSYTYGETITVTGTVKATGTAPAATLTLRSVPAAQQVALFAADGTQLTDPVNVVNGAYTLTYNTTDKGILPAASITLTVKFVGDDNMADQSAAVTVALTAKSVEPVLSGSASKAYDGTNAVTDASNLAINLNGIIAGDNVSAAAADYAYADETVGQSKSITANGITLSGEDNSFYTLARTEASAQIGEIKKAMLISVTEPADTTLDVYCADADTVIGKLPDTVVYHLSDGNTVELKVEWSCTAYDSTPGATNAFAWAVSDSDKLACYEIAQNVADDGTVIVTNSAFLPVTVTGTDAAITYNGTAYDVTQMFAIDSNTGTAVFEIISGGTGEGTLNGSVLTITKAGTITIKVTTAPNAAYAAGEATAILTINKGTPAVTVPTGLTAWYGQKLGDIALPTVDGGTWSWTDMNSTVGDSGVQTHQAIFTPTDTNLWNITTHTVSITVAQAGTSFGEMKVYNGDTETTTFTYGDTITVKAKATAVQPAAFSLRSLIAPTKHQMALFIRNADGSEVQISEAVNEQNGVYTMTYNTAGKALSIGENALIAKFVGDENMADYQETVLVTLNPKELTIASLTAQDRVYEPGNRQVTITGTEVSGKVDADDDVSAIIAGMTATISSENVGTYDTALIPQDVSLTGSHAGYYFATGNVSVSIPQGVEITQATPYTMSGTPAQPVFDPIYQDGTTLGGIPVSLPDGTFNVPGTIEWEAPGNTPVTEGTPFTWVFTPDDSNWKPVTGTVVIYPDGEPPVITAPAGDQEVTVYEGEQGTMAITAEDAASYQWYINRYDGLGYVPISGATSASYTTSVVNLGNNGFTYYCVASNAYGETESPVFLLQVLEKVEVPETGDQSNISLWIALMLLSIAGLTIIITADRRGKMTR